MYAPVSIAYALLVPLQLFNPCSLYFPKCWKCRYVVGGDQSVCSSSVAMFKQSLKGTMHLLYWASE